MHLTLYRGAFAPEPVREDDPATFEEVTDGLEYLVKLVSAAPKGSDHEEQKKYLFAFSPHRLTKPYRKLENVAEVTMAVIDVDRCNLDKLRKAIKATGLEAFVYTSPSDNPDGDPEKRRVRVVAPTSRPMTIAECGDVRKRFAELLGIGPGQGVEGAIDAAKLFFCGALHGTPPRQCWRFHGATLDVDDLLTLPLEFEWGKAKAAAVDLVPLSELPPADEGIAAALGPWDAHDGRRWYLCGALGGVMRKLGFSRARCEAAIREWLPVGDSRVDVAAAVKQACGAWRYPPEDVSGVEILAELLGESHASVVFDACEIASRSSGHDAVVKHAKAKAKAKNAKAAKAKLRAEPEPDEHDEDPEADSDPEARAFTTPDVSPLGSGAVFLMTPKGKDHWYFDPRTETYEEVGLSSLHVALDLSGAATYVETKNGQKRLSPQTIIDNGPTAIVKKAVADFGRAGNEWDQENDRILLGVKCPEFEPVHDPACEAWLLAISGEQVLSLYEWIASTRQDAMHRLATALAVIGPHGIGKSLLAIVCAHLWGAEPLDLAHVSAQFNASSTECPIVLDDEAKTLSKRLISTEEFRVLVQNRSRRYEPKGKERRTLLGAQRYVITANDLSALTFSNAMGAGAADAIAERLTILEVSEEKGDEVRALLDALRRPDGEIDLDRMAKHFEWIRQNVTLPDGRVRFLGAGADKTIARQAVVSGVVAEHELVFDRLRELLTGARKPDAGLFVARERVWLCPGKLLESLVGDLSDRYDARRLRMAVAPFRGPSSALRTDKGVVRAWELDPVRITEALGLSPSKVAGVLSAYK